MKLNARVISLSIVAAVAVAAVSFFLWLKWNERESAWEKVSKETKAQLLAVQQTVAAQDKRMLAMQAHIDTLEQRVRNVGRTAQSGLTEIEKTRREMEQKYAELSGLTDSELDAVIAAGIAEYRKSHGQAGDGGDRAGVGSAEGAPRDPASAVGADKK